VLGVILCAFATAGLLIWLDLLHAGYREGQWYLYTGPDSESQKNLTLVQKAAALRVARETAFDHIFRGGWQGDSIIALPLFSAIKKTVCGNPEKMHYILRLLQYDPLSNMGSAHLQIEIRSVVSNCVIYAFTLDDGSEVPIINDFLGSFHFVESGGDSRIIGIQFVQQNCGNCFEFQAIVEAFPEQGLVYRGPDLKLCCRGPDIIYTFPISERKS
jgi:hypothetical protein